MRPRSIASVLEFSHIKLTEIENNCVVAIINPNTVGHRASPGLTFVLLLVFNPKELNFVLLLAEAKKYTRFVADFLIDDCNGLSLQFTRFGFLVDICW